ncbi:MAG TPA: peptidoglycan DD-metalloendopeptidase family protein, partial [Acidimicrobiia bacterium]
MFTVFAIAAVCLSPPVSGPVIADYAPQGQYEGHWGVDYEASPGETVRSPASGRVTFAGSVAGMLTVTVEPLPGLKASVSYLAEVVVRTGQSVTRGEILGRAGTPHGMA